MTTIHIDDAGHYEPGDMPPKGYLQWHEWARVQNRAGLKQVRCCRCGKWRFPQEMAGGTCFECLDSEVTP